MKLTRRGRVVVYALLFGVVVLVAFLTAPYDIDYYNYDTPRIVKRS